MKIQKLEDFILMMKYLGLIFQGNVCFENFMAWLKLSDPWD